VKGLAVALALCLAPALAHADDQGTEAPAPTGVQEHDVVEVQPSKKPIKKVTVDNPLGNIRVEGHDGKGLVIFAYKHAPDDASLEQLRVSLVPDPDGPVRITTAIVRGGDQGDQGKKVTLPAGDVRIDLVVRAPRNAKVDARIGKGELVIRNMDAGGDLDAGAGSITVENVSGTIYARSVDGDQSFAEVFGDLDAQAIAADLLFNTIRGDELYASVHHGTIDAHRVASKRIELRSTRGRIHLDGELALGGQLLIATRRGDVDVRVKSAGALKVRARAGTDLAIEGADRGTTDKEDGWVRAQYGRGKRPGGVELRSKYGAVRFEIIE